MTHKARIWPDALVQAVVRGIQKERNFQHRQREGAWLDVIQESGSEGQEEEAEEIYAAEDAESEDPQEEDEEEDEETMEDAQRRKEDQARGDRLSHEQKALVNRLHLNMGHLPMDRMVVMLKAANAKESVLRYVKEEFKCEHCMRQRREISRRPAAFPRTFEFNRIIGVDTFFVKWKGKSIPFLNVVDHGSNWQTVVMTRPVGGDTQEPSGGNPVLGQAVRSARDGDQRWWHGVPRQIRARTRTADLPSSGHRPGVPVAERESRTPRPVAQRSTSAGDSGGIGSGDGPQRP